jgi:hypothetical protein
VGVFVSISVHVGAVFLRLLILDSKKRVHHNLASLLSKSVVCDSVVRKAKKSCKNKYLGDKVKVKKLDANRKKLHNLVSLLLTNTTLCWGAKCFKHAAKAGLVL